MATTEPTNQIVRQYDEHSVAPDNLVVVLSLEEV